jgi:hypothetical protein
VLGKFGLEEHVRSPTPIAIRSPTPITKRFAEWQQIDSCIVNWIYSLCPKKNVILGILGQIINKVK